MKAVNLVTPEHEHEFEAAHGLPEALPANEALLWQGSPDAIGLARQALHIDKLLIYFGALLLWRLTSGWYDGQSAAQIGRALLVMAGLATAALGLLSAIAWLIARTTVYSITNRRVVMRVGVVLSITFNLPFAQIASASVRPRSQGCGDIALALSGEGRIAYLHLWPHVRPWRLRHTEPMLRALADAGAVAAVLAGALEQAAQQRAASPAVPASAALPPSLPQPMRPVLVSVDGKAPPRHGQPQPAQAA